MREGFWAGGVGFWIGWDLWRPAGETVKTSVFSSRSTRAPLARATPCRRDAVSLFCRSESWAGTFWACLFDFPTTLLRTWS